MRSFLFDIAIIPGFVAIAFGSFAVLWVLR
jgi:hypothetical protein